MNGKIYLVGAGPGDPGLLTLKGKAALERADCVVYDFLANEELLRWTRVDAEKIPVGKRGGRLRFPQNRINRLLVRKARAGRIVARLKGGDPFIFGRGGEEAEALARARIPFEVVPGVTSGYAAPAYAGIPVTHRDFSSSVSFVTGHAEPDEVPSRLDWSRQVARGGTLVFYMGARNLPEIVARLIASGRDPATPVAVVRWGTRPDQQVVAGTLANIIKRGGGIRPPAITVVGDVVKLRGRLNWFERLPLFGKRIAVTRSREQAGALRDPLEALGARVLELPTIEIRPPRSWKPLDRAIQRLADFDFLLVTSVHGARNFFERLAAAGSDARALKGLTIGAIGPATAAELANSGIRTDFVPREYRAEGLLAALARHSVRGKAFLIPRARIARDLVPRALARRGARVTVVAAYRTVTPRFRPGELKRLLFPVPDLITFTSSSTAANFKKLLGHRAFSDVRKRASAASIGPITSRTLRKLGLRVAIEAKESTTAGLVRAIKDYFRGARRRSGARARRIKG